MTTVKKIVLPVTVLILFFFLSSCTAYPNMCDLLSYQDSGFKADVSIDDGGVFSCSVIKKDGELTFALVSPEPLSGVIITASKDVTAKFGEISVPLPGGAYIKPARWAELFRLSPSEIWRIEKKRLGGSEYYICASDGYVVYIDTVSGTPVRLQKGDTVINILSFRQED